MNIKVPSAQTHRHEEPHSSSYLKVTYKPFPRSIHTESHVGTATHQAAKDELISPRCYHFPRIWRDLSTPRSEHVRVFYHSAEYTRAFDVDMDAEKAISLGQLESLNTGVAT
jgi:hypothetical protein